MSLPSPDVGPLPNDATPSERITRLVLTLDDWRGEVLAEVRGLIRVADPGAIESWRFSGTPTWEHAGVLCTGEVYREMVRLTFPRGAELEDPQRLFNGSLAADNLRAIEITRAAASLDPDAFSALILAAVSLNTGR